MPLGAGPLLCAGRFWRQCGWHAGNLLRKRVVSAIRRIACLVSLLVAFIKGWDGAWVEVALAIAVFVAIVSGGARSAPLGETMDT